MAPRAGALAAGQATSYIPMRLQPSYRTAGPLADLLRKVDPSLDRFPAEVAAANIEEVLNRWSTAFLQSPQAGLDGIEKHVASDFRGSDFRRFAERVLRADGGLDVRQKDFDPAAMVGSEEFLQSLSGLLADYSALDAAEFKVDDIQVVEQTPLNCRTRVHYNWAGPESDGRRAQRSGTAEISWKELSSGELALTDWKSGQASECRASAPFFEEITAEVLAGVPSFSAQLSRGADYWRSVLDAATGIDLYWNNGIAAGDFDSDGFDDLYICQPSGLPNRLYRNRGDGTFEDVTERAGVGILDATPSALFADMLNRGLQDLLVMTATEPLLFLNQGDGTFRLKSDAFHFRQPPQGTFSGAAFGDYDRDGKLDVYLCLYSYYEGLGEYRYPSPYHDAQNGPPNFLFHNQGDGTFRDVTEETGMNQNNSRFSFDCHWCDYDGDGHLDLYVVNDFGRKNLYHNNGDGTFTDAAEKSGVLDIGPGMSGCWFDYDNDGKMDLYVSDMWEDAGKRISAQADFMPHAPEEIRKVLRRHARGNSLFHNTGAGQFEDKSDSVHRSGWSWSCQDWDFDHDGYSDLYIANGFVSGSNPKNLESFFWRQVVANSPLSGRSPEYELGWDALNELVRSDWTWAGRQRNVLYVNNRDGTFTEGAGALGLDFLDDSRAFALADFDHDGRQEMFLKNRTGPQLRVLRNVAKGIGDSVAIRLRGTTSNRDAIGALVTVEWNGRAQKKLLKCGSGYSSQYSKEMFFGLGREPGPLRVTILWPSGTTEVFENVPPNHRIEIEEGAKDFRAEAFAKKAPPQGGRRAHPREETLPAAVGTWLIAPLQAPDFSLPDFDGRNHTLSDLKGAPVLLTFWTSESRASVDLLVGLQKESAASRIRHLLAINLDPPATATHARSMVRNFRFSFPVLVATEEVLGIYNLLFRYLFERHKDLPIPTAFLLDDQGSIAKVYQGLVAANEIVQDIGRIPRNDSERQKLALPFSGTHRSTFKRNYFAYGLLFAQHGYQQAAEKAFLLGIRQEPTSADAYYDLGTLYMQQQKWDQANEMLVKAIQLKPHDLMGLNNLGIIAARQGRSQDAERYFNQALDLDPANALAVGNLSDLYGSTGDLARAQQILESALQQNAENSELNYKLGLLYAQQGRDSQAQKYLENAVRLEPNNGQALNNLGVVYAMTGQLERAAQTFTRCIQLDPKLDQPYLNLARVKTQMGDNQQAIQVLRDLLKQIPGHPVAQEYLKDLGAQ